MAETPFRVVVAGRFWAVLYGESIAAVRADVIRRLGALTDPETIRIYEITDASF